jgi:hypothetical protein
MSKDNFFVDIALVRKSEEQIQEILIQRQRAEIGNETNLNNQYTLDEQLKDALTKMSETLRHLSEALVYYKEFMDDLEFNRRKNVILQFQDCYKKHRDLYEREILNKNSFNKEAQHLAKLLEEGNKEEVSLLLNKKRKSKNLN